ncbi:MAG TPA: 6,7-dimethyl-8-ribityllumazine synthase [Candidatus Polarisedimenticolia bacterium]|nr:6,7-dimethyl-8-ribityllumazine synthase [Candidatus Polarisedimenticolia bacterium]
MGTTATTIEGGTSAKGLRIALVASRFNEFAAGKLLAGALECLTRQGADETDLLVVRVPGAWEIPIVARRLAEARRHDAVIALGVLIRGETAHFDLIASQVASGLASAAEQTGVPVVFGVVTAENADQALDRAGGKQGNRGWEAAKAAIEMAGVMKQMGKP